MTWHELMIWMDTTDAPLWAWLLLVATIYAALRLLHWYARRPIRHRYRRP